MLNIIRKTLIFFLKVFLYTLCGVLIIAFFLIPVYLKGLPELSIWHTQRLESEFKKGRGINSFDAYLALEKTLFGELEKEIIQKLPMSQQTRLNRFHQGSMAFPGSDTPNWNRSFVLEAPSPNASVLLLHGLTDSPYSLRNIGQKLNEKGAFVLGLRLPGHGTAPSGLLDVTWEDMAAAVELAMRYIHKENPGQPVCIIGYSTGAALALEYSLHAQADSGLKNPDGLVFLSPAMGVAKIAALAQFNELLSRLPGFGKMGWTDIFPEYNPYKYNSFTANAGNQVYRLTREVQHNLARLKEMGSLDRFPKILSFQSIADATVSTAAIVESLYQQLTEPGHELVVFDINRSVDLQALITKDPVPSVHRLLERVNPNFTVTFVTNMDHGSHVFVHQKKEARSAIEKTALNMDWPNGIYSLSHIALPFKENDPLYGRRDLLSNRLNLGDIPLRGERGLLTISPNEIIRLKWNPFYPFMEDKITHWIYGK